MTSPTPGTRRPTHPRSHRARRFENSLFGPSADNFVRGLQTAEANAKLDRTLGAFLRLLSPHFLQSAAHKALEFLIRRFEIHKYNVTAVLGCILPYHSTRWFVRMVQLLRLDETCWRWLQGKQGVSPPTRAVIVSRCRKDARVLKQLCLLGFEEADEPCCRGRVTFATVVLLELLSGASDVSEADLFALMPHVLSLLLTPPLLHVSATHTSPFLLPPSPFLAVFG